MSFTAPLPFEMELPWFEGAIDWAIDANGRRGRDGGNDGVRMGWNLEGWVEFLRVADDERGEGTNGVA
jgi:hypothetical protein